LVTAQEVEQLQEKLDRIAAEIERCVDLDRLAEIANNVRPISCIPPSIPKIVKNPLHIAVAKDKAFCFYYRDSLDLLEEMGAELVFCSPIKDQTLPANIDGLFLGGGYPELYAKQLSENKAFLNDLQTKIADGLPCIAECGGFMYLHETMQDADHISYPMAGVVKGESIKTDHLVRFGYAELTANRDNLLCEKGESIRVHEFHYWDSTENGTTFTATKPRRNRSWQCVVGTKNLFAGYPHMHFYSNPKFAENFLHACAAYRQNREHS
jgi:cobyrinic acid a,c-diamide synthase